jgi:hypothetical protein
MRDALDDFLTRRRFRRHPDDLGLRRAMTHHPAKGTRP